MNINDLLIKTNNRSINNYSCLGPCHEADTIVLHPITFKKYTSNQNFCMIYDVINNKYIDECVPNDANIDDTFTSQFNSIIPTFDINATELLNICYDIKSFDDAIDWILSNKNSPRNTQQRIMKYSWKLYGDDLSILNEKMISAYNYFIKKFWISIVYKNVIKQLNYSISKDKFKDIFIKYLDNNNLYKILVEFITNNKSDWLKIDSHNTLILDLIAKNILEII